MKNIFLKPLFGLILLFSTYSVFSHHSVAEFDIEKDITVRAKVTEVWFNNPHVRFYAVQINDDGKEISWDMHTSSPNSLIRRGWYSDAIKAGETVSFIGSPTRSGEPRMLVHTVELPDGKVVSSRRQ